jgi:hypothetical protein
VHCFGDEAATVHLIAPAEIHCQVHRRLVAAPAMTPC